MFTNLNEIFEEIKIVRVEGGGGYGIRIVLTKNVVEDTSRHNHCIGFALKESLGNAWPSPYRNLNNTGKLLVPNYAFPSIPETVGEFVARTKIEGDAGQHAMEFNLPGIGTDGDKPEFIGFRICVLDPYNYELKKDGILYDEIIAGW